MKVGDCYPGDVVIINGQKWELGHWSRHVPDAVQAHCLENVPRFSGVICLKLDQDIEKVVRHGIDEVNHPNELGYLESVIKSGCWAPLHLKVESAKEDYTTYLMNDSEKKLVEQIYAKYREQGFEFLIPSNER